MLYAPATQVVPCVLLLRNGQSGIHACRALPFQVDNPLVGVGLRVSVVPIVMFHVNVHFSRVAVTLPTCSLVSVPK